MKLVLLLVLICLGTGIAALIRTLTIPVRKSDYKPLQGDPRAEEYAAKLSQMVQYDTTSSLIRGRHSSGITRFWHRCFRWCTRDWRS